MGSKSEPNTKTPKTWRLPIHWKYVGLDIEALGIPNVVGSGLPTLVSFCQSDLVLRVIRSTPIQLLRADYHDGSLSVAKSSHFVVKHGAGARQIAVAFFNCVL